MKTLLLLRHGKSDWDADYGPDHDRPLADRGQKGARKMGRFITSARLVPDRAITSSAVRARETLATAAESGGWTGPAQVTEALYDATPEAVLDEIRQTPDDVQTLIVVGHQPTWAMLTSALVGGGAIEMKTAALARVDLNVDRWADAGPGRGVLAMLLPPRALRPNAYRKLKKSIEKAIKAQRKAKKQAEKTAAPPEPEAKPDAEPHPTEAIPRGGVE